VWWYYIDLFQESASSVFGIMGLQYRLASVPFVAALSIYWYLLLYQTRRMIHNFTVF